MALISKYIVFFISMFLYCSNSFCKTYSVKSFQGTLCNVKVVNDYAKNGIDVSYNGKGFYSTGVTGIDGDIKIIQNHFLAITYRLRAGSGVRERITVLYCVSNNQLYEAIRLISEYKSDFTGTYNQAVDSTHLFDEGSYYNVDFIFGKEYEAGLKIKFHKKKKSHSNPLGNYERNDSTILNFDKNRNLFFNDKKRLKGNFVIEKWDETGYNIHLDKIFPVIKIDDREYFYIDSVWMEKGVQNSFIQYGYPTSRSVTE